jgi:hypothetical protein
MVPPSSCQMILRPLETPVPIPGPSVRVEKLAPAHFTPPPHTDPLQHLVSAAVLIILPPVNPSQAPVYTSLPGLTFFSLFAGCVAHSCQDHRDHRDPIQVQESSLQVSGGLTSCCCHVEYSRHQRCMYTLENIPPPPQSIYKFLPSSLGGGGMKIEDG